MLYMNEYDITEAWRLHQHHPVLGPATRTLAELADWTNRNSDGWAYWPKPVRAAKQLIELIQANHPYRRRWDAPEVTAAEYRKALRPIKSFRTRHGANFDIAEV